MNAFNIKTHTAKTKNIFFCFFCVFLRITAIAQMNPGASDAGTSKYTILGDGQGRLTRSNDQSTGLGTGSLGVNAENNYQRTHFLVTVISSISELKSKEQIVFARSLLVPAFGQYGFNFSYRRANLFNSDRFGLNIAINATSTKWTVDSTTTLSESLTTSAGDIRFAYHLLPPLSGDNRLILSLEAGMSARGILGDINQNRDLRVATLGTTRNYFLGWNAGVFLMINGITASAYLTTLYGDDIKGLTGGQFVASFGVTTDFINFPGK